MKKIYLSVLLLTAGVWMNCAAQATLNLNLFLEGYYIGSSQMQPVLMNQNIITATGAEVDTITVELHDGTIPSIIIQSATGILMIDGTASLIFSNSVIGKSCYIAVKHRNAIQTWSKNPMTMGATTNYDFTSAVSQAYGNNMLQCSFAPNLWSFYTGDFNQDENIDLLDYSPLDFNINNGVFGYYAEDLNGDGNVDLLDFPTLDANINNGIYSHHP